MKTQAHPTIHRKDYRPPTFAVERIEMGIDLDPRATVVAARLRVVRRASGPLALDGEGLTLLSLSIDGVALPSSGYRVSTQGERQTLAIDALPDACDVDVAVRISPATNTSLMGLYVSGGNFFTQCEAEGFRKIVFFPDRPDVMARYTVMLRADRRRYPVLLSNGNLVDAGDLPDGRHYAKWDDPFPKPSYLFALVAGKLSAIERRVATKSGRSVLLQVYTEARDLPKAGYALDSLERAMRWDEQRFGLELDLDRFMIVAVGDFNMGAMENKGLNVFNTKYVLADPRTETDADFANVEAVVGHEYFHNWTGNRVTCRDWFQLTLKEGLTVFRDQEFSADMAVAQLGDDVDDARAGRRARHAADRQRPQPARRAVPRGRRPDGASDPARELPGDRQLLHRDGLPEGLGGRPHAADAARTRRPARRTRRILPPPRRLGRVVRGLRRRDGDRSTRPPVRATTCSAFGAGTARPGTPRVGVGDDYDAATERYTLTLRQICPRVGVEKLAGRRQAAVPHPVRGRPRRPPRPSAPACASTARRRRPTPSSSTSSTTSSASCSTTSPPGRCLRCCVTSPRR